jgi:hypothetical protein
VAEGKVDYQEALARAVDKADLARRCNKPAPGSDAPPPTGSPAARR